MSKTKKSEIELTVNNEQGEAQAEPEKKEVKTPRKRETMKKTEEKKDEEKTEKKPRAPRVRKPKNNPELVNKEEENAPVEAKTETQGNEQTGEVAQAAEPKNEQQDEKGKPETTDADEADEDESEENSAEALADAQKTDEDFEKQVAELSRDEQIRRRHARNRTIKGARRGRRKASQDKRQAEHQAYIDGGKPNVVKVEVPEKITCYVHCQKNGVQDEILTISTDLNKNMAYGLNRTLVDELGKIDSIPESDPKFKVIQLMRSLGPQHFNFEQAPPAFCLTALRAVEKAMGILRPMLTRDAHVLRQPLSYSYDSAYTHWKQWRDKKRGDLEGSAWTLFDDIIKRHCPELNSHDPQVIAIAKMSQECFDELRKKLMEQPEVRYFRRSEAAKCLRDVFEINRRTWEEDMLAEALANREKAEQDRLEHEGAVLEEVDGLLGILGVGSIQAKEEAVEDESEVQMREWLMDAVSGKLTTAHELLSFHDMVEMFAQPDAPIQSMVPGSSEEPGTQFSTFLGRNSVVKSTFVTVTVPVMVVNREGEPLKDKTSGKRIYVPRYIIMSAREGWLAARLRREQLVKKLLSQNPGMEMKDAEIKVRAMRDDRASWKQGKLKDSLGNLGVFDLPKTVAMILDKASNQEESGQSAAPRRNTRGGNQNGNHGEASDAETQAWLAGQDPANIGSKPRMKGQG
ncbi:MAG: hypothetical protein PHN19_05620 [Patescibacteria group bacterium]|nr:hypothetical protein [Patescibacteria group bacterium]